MELEKVAAHIVGWMDDYCKMSGQNGFVVGVSGGIDSALCSTLAAMTGRRTLCLTMPIHQAASQVSRADEHIAWLKSKYANVESMEVDLTDSYDTLIAAAGGDRSAATFDLTCANTRSRMRMMSLYFHAGLNGLLVVGTGNKVEDFGVGFFTKYGDGGVDFSPIADLVKSEVFAVAKQVGVCDSILTAAPTDGLFGDDRTDEQQIGATYPELEWAMAEKEAGRSAEDFEGRQREVFEIFTARNRANKHKMNPIPVCEIPEELK